MSNQTNDVAEERQSRLQHWGFARIEVSGEHGAEEDAEEK